MDETSEQNGRRTFCKGCIGCLTAGSVATVGYPVVSFLGFPQRLSTSRPIEVPLADLPTGQAQYAQLRGRPIAVLMTEEGPLVLSVSCTHLGCTVIWVAADTVFRCPCHGAVFDAAGKVVSGPVNAPLKRIPFEIVEGRIIVA